MWLFGALSWPNNIQWHVFECMAYSRTTRFQVRKATNQPASQAAAYVVCKRYVELITKLTLVKSHLLLDGRQAGTPALLLCATIVSARSGSHLKQLLMIVIKRETAVSKVEVTAHYTVAKPSRFVSAPDPTDACGMLCNLRVLICWKWSGQSPISL